MENTKEYILEEAFKLFLTHTYEGVSISKLSSAIGMTKGALYHHFKNKEELFRMVIDKFLDFPEIKADFQSISLYKYVELSIVNAEKAVRSLFRFSNVYTPLDYMSLIADAFRHYTDYADIKGKFISNEIDKITIVIKNAIKSGEIRKDINIEIIASNFFAINLGLAGNLIRNYPLEETIKILRKQNLEFYKLLKHNK